MLKIINKIILFILVSLNLTACSGFFDKDNTPTPSSLVKFTPEFQPRKLWSRTIGSSIGDDYLRLTPSVNDFAVFTTSANGKVAASDKTNGKTLWEAGAGFPVTTGPGIGDNLVVMGSRRGEISALRQDNGLPVWRITIPGTLLAKPAIADGKVFIKTMDGTIHALSVLDGHELWVSQQTEPNLILRGSSSPVISDHNLFVGFANGNLAKLSMRNGDLLWLQPIALPNGAFAIQRMVDIDADPLVLGHRIYAATYQGQIASLDWASGRTLWSRDISSYTGMVADNRFIYITDAQGQVWCFDAATGETKWRQTKLVARVLTAPALMGHYLVVGDAQGYLHWLSLEDGHFAARIYVGALYAAPVVQNNVLYVYTNRGYLAAYSLG